MGGTVRVEGGELGNNNNKKKKPRPQSKKENKRVMRKKVVACVCYHGSSALVFTAWGEFSGSHYCVQKKMWVSGKRDHYDQPLADT